MKMLCDEFYLPEGSLRVEWPASMSPESAADVRDYLVLLDRKLRRAEKQQEPWWKRGC